MGESESGSPHLGVELVGHPVSRVEKEVRGYYLKFDLTRPALGEVAGLLDQVKLTGAVRTCVLFKTHGAWERNDVLPVTYMEDLNWNVIKIPSIEGTELWVIPESKQGEVEIKMKFGKASNAVVSTTSKIIHALTYRDPLYRNEVTFRWRNDVICTSITGATILSPTGTWTMEQLANLKDLGSFAFED